MKEKEERKDSILNEKDREEKKKFIRGTQ